MICKRCGKLALNTIFRTYCSSCSKIRNDSAKAQFERDVRNKVRAEQFEREVMIDQPYKLKRNLLRRIY